MSISFHLIENRYSKTKTHLFTDLLGQRDILPILYELEASC